MSTKLLLIFIFVIALPISTHAETGCEGWTGFWNCGYYSNYGTCYEDNAGNYLGCDGYPGGYYASY